MSVVRKVRVRLILRFFKCREFVFFFIELWVSMDVVESFERDFRFLEDEEEE